MWEKLAQFIVKTRLVLLAILLGLSAAAIYYTTKVQMGYEFSKAIPYNHPAFATYNSFKQKFGDDGTVLALAIQTNDFFTPKVYTAYNQLQQNLRKLPAIQDVGSVTTAAELVLDRENLKTNSQTIFPKADTITAENLLAIKEKLYAQKFYKGLLYNPETNAYLMAVRINKDSINSNHREAIIKNVEELAGAFTKQTNIPTYLSGLPYIRTSVAVLIQGQMQYLLIASLVLSAIMLLLFFRSLGVTVLSLVVVLLGVAFGLGCLHLLGYKITLLTALLPPLIVVIGIPNCIYIINKYHSSYLSLGNKKAAIIDAVSSMGVVTLFCNIAAAVGFAVFALTRSPLLREFGIVSGIAIFLVFIISIILIPVALYYLPAPRARELSYLNNALINKWINSIVVHTKSRAKTILTVSAIISAVGIAGIFLLKQKAFIVDDLPKNNKVLTDLKFIEQHFKGIMPVEIVIDTKKRKGLKNAQRSLKLFEKMDSLELDLAANKVMAKPLSVVDGLKLLRQAYYEDTAMYGVPDGNDIIGIADYLNTNEADTAQGTTSTSKILNSFIDSNKQYVRISASMADVGTEELPAQIQEIDNKIKKYFTDTTYNVSVTGASITFNEGSSFIIKGLQESILWAFAIIAFCMFILFRNWRIVLCSLIPNIIPLLLTAGVMGITGVPLKPSTVLVFSVALGIAIDITIRFLVTFKQQLPLHQTVSSMVDATLKQTGLSITYTALVLIAGFAVFITSQFGGTFSLGWLTAFTLFTATITNLYLLPVLLNLFYKKKN
jgi:uncharacterized protein